MRLKLLFMLGLGILMVQSHLLYAESVAGTYRCWMFNVAGAGKRCTNSALVLKENGQYMMGNEKGTYKIKNGKIILSESKFRGSGQFQEHGNQIMFEYTYRGWPQTVTYLKQDLGGVPSSAKGLVEGERNAASVSAPMEKKEAPRVNIDLTIHFPEGDKSVGWVNGAAIIEEGEATGPETLANNDGKSIVTTYFRSMPAGRVYKIYTTTGFEKRFVGTIDLRDAKDDVKLTLYAK